MSEKKTTTHENLSIINMGVNWYYKAEVVTTEPEIVKELIWQIAEDTAPVCNLEIKGNSIFFDSDGYGCFGLESENYEFCSFI